MENLGLGHNFDPNLLSSWSLVSSDLVNRDKYLEIAHVSALLEDDRANTELTAAAQGGEENINNI